MAWSIDQLIYHIFKFGVGTFYGYSMGQQVDDLLIFVTLDGVEKYVEKSSVLKDALESIPLNNTKK